VARLSQARYAYYTVLQALSVVSNTHTRHPVYWRSHLLQHGGVIILSDQYRVSIAAPTATGVLLGRQVGEVYTSDGQTFLGAAPPQKERKNFGGP